MEKLKILLVDDEEDILELISDLLNEIVPNKTDLARNGKVALDLTLSNKYDLIITDYKMPVLNGEEFVKALRKEQNSATPVIMFSGFIDDKTVAPLHDLPGFFTFFSKPFKEQQLRQVIAAQLDLDL